MKKIKLKKSNDKSSKIKLTKKHDSEEKYFISSGSDNLNLALTGDIDKGFCVGRIANIVGDYSTGKTLLACEAVNSVWYLEHLIKGKKVKIVYDEAEAAFDFDLAESFGMPLDEITFEESETVEEFHRNIYKHIKQNQNVDILLYIQDSLDALSDEAEKRDLSKSLKVKKKDDDEDGKDDKDDEKAGKGGYGAAKAKYLSKMFRNVARDLKRTNCILIIISQIRDDLKARYGTKAKRSGGKALDFYCSHVIWLDEKGVIQSAKFKIPQGSVIEAYIRKNKLASPRRKANFDLLHTHGVNNFGSLIEFCATNGGINKSGGHYAWDGKKYYKNDLVMFFSKNKKEYRKLRKVAQKTWNQMEADAKIELGPKWSYVDEED